MRESIVPIQSLREFRRAITELGARSPGMPGMGLAFGPTGSGKTTAATMAANEFNAVYVRARAVWTPNAMLGDLCRSLGGRTHARAADNFDEVVRLLGLGGRPLFIDEAEYVMELRDKGLDILRDLHDVTTVPILLIGMSERGPLSINRQIAARSRLAQVRRRIGSWVEFGRLSWEDAQAVAIANCEVGVDDALLKHVLDASEGRVGAFTVGLAKIEQFAQYNGLIRVRRSDWSGELSLGEGDL
ncbi:MAG: ATP-binding protein [Cyanobacteria bacterium P01_H01_bin.130]